MDGYDTLNEKNVSVFKASQAKDRISEAKNSPKILFHWKPKSLTYVDSDYP